MNLGKKKPPVQVVAKNLERNFYLSMSNVTQKKKNDKVIHSGKFSITDIIQIIRGDLKYGYADISIRNIGDGYFEISKWNLGESQ